MSALARILRDQAMAMTSKWTKQNGFVMNLLPLLFPFACPSNGLCCFHTFKFPCRGESHLGRHHSARAALLLAFPPATPTLALCPLSASVLFSLSFSQNTVFPIALQESCLLNSRSQPLLEHPSSSSLASRHSSPLPQP